MKTRRKGIGEEDKMHIQFGLLLQQYEHFKKMPDVLAWSYLPMGEYRKPSTAAMLKKKGVKSGWPDYIFFVYSKNKPINIIYLEFKTSIGKQQKTQKDFELTFAGSPNSQYYLVRSVQEAIKICEEESILKI